MSATSITESVGFAAGLRVICLACHHESNSVAEHKEHQAKAGHLDEGEAYK